jgi:hypothetical protein
MSPVKIFFDIGVRYQNPRMHVNLHRGPAVLRHPAIAPVRSKVVRHAVALPNRSGASCFRQDSRVALAKNAG